MVAKAHVFARLSLSGRKYLFSNLEYMLILSPGDLKSAPLSDPNPSVDIQSEMIRELWNAAHAYSRRSDQSVNICPLCGARPILDASSLPAGPKAILLKGRLWRQIIGAKLRS